MSHDRHTVLHLIAPGPVGGAESMVERLAYGQQCADQRPVVVTVLTEAGAPPSLVTALERDGVDVRRVRAVGRAYVREARMVTRIIRDVQPGVVHTHGYRADLLGGLAAGWAGVPRVTTVHGFTGGGRKNLAYEWLQRRMLRRFEAVVAVSVPLGRELEAFVTDPTRLHVLPNAWSSPAELLARAEARDRLGAPPDEIVLGWVGRLTGEKGLDVALEAVAAVAEPTPVLHVLGDGRLRSELEERARELGIADRVRWHGIVPEAARLFRAFDGLLLSSRTEGTPMVLFEAMHAGVPIVAARVGGVPDVLSPSEGWLVSPEDPAALAAAVRSMLGEPREAKRRAAAARTHLDEAFGVEDWVRRYEAVYRAAASVRP